MCIGSAKRITGAHSQIKRLLETPTRSAFTVGLRSQIHLTIAIFDQSRNTAPIPCPHGKLNHHPKQTHACWALQPLHLPSVKTERTTLPTIRTNNCRTVQIPHQITHVRGATQSSVSIGPNPPLAFVIKG